MARNTEIDSSLGAGATYNVWEELTPCCDSVRWQTACRRPTGEKFWWKTRGCSIASNDSSTNVLVCLSYSGCTKVLVHLNIKKLHNVILYRFSKHFLWKSCMKRLTIVFFFSVAFKPPTTRWQTFSLRGNYGTFHTKSRSRISMTTVRPAWRCDSMLIRQRAAPRPWSGEWLPTLDRHCLS